MRPNFLMFILFITCLLATSLTAQTITGLTLINATTDVEIGEFTDGMELDVSILGENLTVVAETEGTIRSIRFGLDDNLNFRVEGTAPYSLSGDTNGDYGDFSFTLGEHTLIATALDEFAAGNVLDSDTIRFTVVDMPRDITPPANPGTGMASVSGELRKWHRVTLSFDGPGYNEVNTGAASPFLDYRFDVTFNQGTDTLVVPGYFAADGNAAETSADSGNVWRCHFAPPATGDWNYTVDFRLGNEAAVNDDPGFGTPITPLHGQAGTFTIDATDKLVPDNRARGRLSYVGEHYLQYAETGEYFVKGGPDSPENFLAYDDFDNTPNAGDLRKNWTPHVADHQTGDPVWQNGKGRGIIGAVNYLASKGLNAFSFLTMNVQGDDKNVFPYVEPLAFATFDCSKLDQWEIVFNHADQQGMYLHFKTQETENDQLLDGGEVGRDRKLYYRQLIARFGHHLALNWNMGEENTQSVAQRRQMAQYFADNDPYGHHRVIHTYPNQTDQVYNGLIGDQSLYTGPSIQTRWNNVHTETGKWVARSTATGRKWVVANDEQGSANIGVPPDTDWEGFTPTTPDMNGIRRQTLWGNLMAGGAGVEYYFGYQVPETDLSAQNYRSRDRQWEYVSHALSLFRSLPLTRMAQNDDLVDAGNWCFARPGLDYVVYLPNGGTSFLRLFDDEPYQVDWFNPRTGETLAGSLTTVTGPGNVALGDPPAEATEDWAVRVFRGIGANALPVAAITLVDQTELTIEMNGTASTDADGNIVGYAWDFGDGTTGAGETVSHTYSQAGAYDVVLSVTDNDGGVSLATLRIDFEFMGLCGEPVAMFSRDFPFEGTMFYLDNFTGTGLLAIDATQDTTATVRQAFAGATCIYDLTFHGVGENDGASSFKLFVDDQLVGDIVLPVSSESFEFGTAYNFTFENIPVRRGADIKVYGKVGTDGTEFSQARWLKIDFEPVENPRGCLDVWEEENGIVTIEMEHGNITENWRRSSAEPGFLGDGYIEWTGAEFFNSSGNGRVVYPIKITKTGTYRFEWRVMIGRGDSNTEHNDTWWKIEGANIYAQKTGALYKPKPDCNNDPAYDCPMGTSTNNFFKIYGNNLNWRFVANTSDNDPTPVFVDFDEPGTYNMVINARSSFQRLDRAVLYHVGDVNRDNGLATGNPETQCNGVSDFDLKFVVSDGFELYEGATVSVDDGLRRRFGDTDENGEITFPGLSIDQVNYSYLVTAPDRPDVFSDITFGSDLTVLVTLPWVTGLRDARPELNFTLFPNPATEAVTIGLPVAAEMDLRLFDVNGRFLRRVSAYGRMLEVSTAALPAGIYFVEVGTAKGVGRRRLVVR